ncbi:hypothetical protein PUN28_001905 [Cardiocondyla obscurior]|uniref:Uncharacterized protein n=1 Tax=Cardiocondyla obscurior TaxID=286306 RepID=A0AAW2GRP7_9HYME
MQDQQNYHANGKYAHRAGFRNALATFLPTSSFQPHQTVQPFVGFGSPSLSFSLSLPLPLPPSHLFLSLFLSAFNYFTSTEYTPSYETLCVERAING